MPSPIVTHPGKIGDLIYSLPVAEAIAEKHGEKVYFVTSHLCEPVIPLLERQPYIRQTVIHPTYRVVHTSFGAQPWEMPVETDEGQEIYHLGFRRFPQEFATDEVAGYYGLAWDSEFRLTNTYAKRAEVAAVHNYSTQPGNIYPPHIMQEVLNRLGGKKFILRGKNESSESYWGVRGAVYSTYTMDRVVEIIAASKIFIGCLSACSVIAGFTGTPSVILCNHNVLKPFAFEKPNMVYLHLPSQWTILQAIKEVLGGIWQINATAKPA